MHLFVHLVLTFNLSCDMTPLVTPKTENLELSFCL